MQTLTLTPKQDASCFDVTDKINRTTLSLPPGRLSCNHGRLEVEKTSCDNFDECLMTGNQYS